MSVKDLLNEYNVSDYEIADRPYGYSLTYGLLSKTIYVYDRWFHSQEEFNKLGYGVVHRRRDDT